jgi:hypothetical protein
MSIIFQKLPADQKLMGLSLFSDIASEESFICGLIVDERHL